MTEGYGWDQLIKTANEAGFFVLPIGDYACRITNVDVRKSSTGKDQLKVRWEVMTGPNAGKPVNDNMTISPENATAVAIFFRQMDAIGLTEDFFKGGGTGMKPTLHQVATAMVGRTAQLKIGHREWNGGTQMDIQRISPLQGAGAPGGAPLPPAGGPPVPGVAAAPPVAAPPPVPAPTPAPAPAPAPQPVAAPVPPPVAPAVPEQPIPPAPIQPTAPPAPAAPAAPAPASVPAPPPVPASTPSPVPAPASTETSAPAPAAPPAAPEVPQQPAAPAADRPAPPVAPF